MSGKKSPLSVYVLYGMFIFTLAVPTRFTSLEAVTEQAVTPPTSKETSQTASYSIPLNQPDWSKSLEAASQEVAASYLRDGVDTLEELDTLGVSGRPREIICDYIAQEQARQERARLAQRHRRTASVNPTATATATNPRPYDAWAGGVEQWRELAIKYFPPERVEQALLCINIETGGTGNPCAVSKTGKYVGLFQMDSDWGSYEQRCNPDYVMACAANSVAVHGGWDRWPPMVSRGY